MDNIRSDREIRIRGYTSTKRFLGEGTFGLVVEGIHTKTGKLVAIKRLMSLMKMKVYLQHPYAKLLPLND
ncbi:hypothetical protein DSO57_1010264 [Entomophthora muscae]|uniref:Uncharacterized protein n=1 Tax=Entomophthora muscae TaxID=34485 RepID=A0ACC2SJH3_9FUNG|nr:hypothetical protein DSO57_1010264 [Entomophthora muscae]